MGSVVQRLDAFNPKQKATPRVFDKISFRQVVHVDRGVQSKQRADGVGTDVVFIDNRRPRVAPLAPRPLGGRDNVHHREVLHVDVAQVFGHKTKVTEPPALMCHSADVLSLVVVGKSFEHALHAGLARRRLLPLPRQPLVHHNGFTASRNPAHVGGPLEVSNRRGGAGHGDVEGEQTAPVPHPEAVQWPSSLFWEARQAKHQTAWGVHVLAKAIVEDLLAREHEAFDVVHQVVANHIVLHQVRVRHLEGEDLLLAVAEGAQFVHVGPFEQFAEGVHQVLQVFFGSDGSTFVGHEVGVSERWPLNPRLKDALRWPFLVAGQPSWTPPRWSGQQGERMPNIVVLVKQVPDTNAPVSISGGSVDLSGAKMVMSPYDEFALEAALRHKEAAGGEVTAVTLGGAGADKILKDAKAIGADHIVRIDHEGWADSNAVQGALAAAVRDLGAEVVYCGKSAADTGAGSTGPGLAERLGWASASNVVGFDFTGGLTATVPAEGGNARLSVALPAVFSCDKGDLKVRKPNVKGIMLAKKADVDVRAAHVGASSVRVVSCVLPPAKPEGKTFHGGAAAADVARLLREEANVL